MRKRANRLRFSTARRYLPALLAILIAFVAASGCWRSNSTPATSSSKKIPPRLIVSCDTAGWIVPCGCASNQSGGLLRRQSLVKAAAPNGAIIADVGGAAHGVSTYDRLKFEAILRGELAMGLIAHNLGGSELKLGPKYLRDLPVELRGVLVSAGARDRQQQRPIAPAVRLTTIDQQRLALVGVVGEEFATDEVEILPPRQAVLDALASVAGKYDRAVVLAYVNESELEELAQALPEVDLVIGGPTGQSVEPHRAGAVTVTAVTNKGKFVASFDIPPASSNEWTGRILELTDHYPDHPKQRENLNAFYATLAERQLPPAETSFVEPLPQNVPSDFRLAGSQSCMECHQGDCRDAMHKNTAAQDWVKSKHAHAWQTLEKKGAHVDAYCQQCHTTGYGLPGGFVTPAATPRLVSVGCESCHGPSAGHAQSSRQKATAYYGQAKSHCTKCHDRENSPEFEYDRYWAALVGGTSLHSETSKSPPDEKLQVQ